MNALKAESFKGCVTLPELAPTNDVTNGESSERTG